MIRRPLRPEKFVKLAGKSAAGNGGGKKAAAPGPMLWLRGNGAAASAPVDSSAYARTASGPALVRTPKSPYGNSSINFDATDSYLDFGDSADWDFGNGDFTLQAWVWVSSSVTGGSMPVIAQFDDSNSAFYLSVHPTRSVELLTYSGPTLQALGLSSSGGVYPFDTWFHLAGVRSGNNFYTYVNGVMVASGTNTATINNATAPLRLGKATFMTQLIGAIADAEVTKGLCKYPGGTTFAPPSTDALLLHGNAFTDASPVPKSISAIGSATTSSAQYPFAGGGTSFSLPSASSGIQFSSGAATGAWVDMGSSGDFTIEFFVYLTSAPSFAYMLSMGGASGYSIELRADSTSQISFINNGSSTTLTGLSFGTGAWHHVALCRVGGTAYVYLDGSRLTSGISLGSQNMTQTGGRRFGCRADGTSGIVGYIAEARITKGKAHYPGVASFTVPTAPFP